MTELLHVVTHALNLFVPRVLMTMSTPWKTCLMFAEKQLAKYAEWHAPRAGMFLWLKLKHVEDSMDIFEELKEAKVVVVPGKTYMPMFESG